MRLQIEATDLWVSAAMRASEFDDTEAAVIAHHIVDCDLRSAPYGGNSAGYLVAPQAIELAIKKAQQHSIGVVAGRVGKGWRFVDRAVSIEEYQQTKTTNVMEINMELHKWIPV